MYCAEEELYYVLSKGSVEVSTLYLFGNGFDLAHGIYTPYSAFRKHLETEHEEFLRRFEAMYNILPLDDTEPWYTEEAEKRWEERVLLDLWKTFEEQIGHPDIEGMYDKALSLVDGMPEEGVKDTLDYYWRDEYGFAEELQEYVLEWLMTIDTSLAKCKKESLRNAKSDYIINFNYTDTIEQVYGLDNVLHIHGGVPSCSSIKPIMGHGNKYIIESNRRKAEQYEDEFVEWAASIYEAIANYCEALYKDTEKIIAFHNEFFSKLCDIDEIVCFGLSFGDVDIPYLERIVREIKPTTKWIVYYYGEESLKRLKNVFGILGISRSYEIYFRPSDRFWD